MHPTTTLAAGLLATGVSASTPNYLGFNSGSSFANGTAKHKADWVAEFTTAQKLQGSPGTFNAVRLYTNVQGDAPGEPIEAFEAAIQTKTYILLGLWTSGTDSIDAETTALLKAVSQYGKPFTDLVIGVSVGSEDLYRNSVSGIANSAGVGAQPDTIAEFISDFRSAVANTTLSSVPVGHVDTWDAWPNATNKAVLDACDWIGVDEYPYYENGVSNDIQNATVLFDSAWHAATVAAGSKPVWLTETGWPVTGPNWDQAVPSVQNAKSYWDEIGCKRLFNKVPTFWYTLLDSNSADKAQFAITTNLSTTPIYNLTCPATVDDDATPTSSLVTPSPSQSNAAGRTDEIFPSVYYANLVLLAGVLSFF